MNTWNDGNIQIHRSEIREIERERDRQEALAKYWHEEWVKERERASDLAAEAMRLRLAAGRSGL